MTSTTLPALSPDPATTGARRPGAAALLMVLIAWTLTGCGLIGGDDSNSVDFENPTFEFIIPLGASEQLAIGEPLDILPRSMETKVGETIAIHNNDTIAHVLGPWFVGPGEVVRQRFLTVGVYEGSCSVHPDGAFTVTVEPA